MQKLLINYPLRFLCQSSHCLYWEYIKTENFNLIYINLFSIQYWFAEINGWRFIQIKFQYLKLSFLARRIIKTLYKLGSSHENMQVAWKSLSLIIWHYGIFSKNYKDPNFNRAHFSLSFFLFESNFVL